MHFSLQSLWQNFHVQCFQLCIDNGSPGDSKIFIFAVYMYTQGVSLYLRHNLKSKLIHKIQTRHCKQSHAMSYIPQHYDTRQRILT